MSTYEGDGERVPGKGDAWEGDPEHLFGLESES